MPANLPPKYFEIEKKLKTARDSQERIEIYEELLSIIPKHKGTEKLQALYKTKIAKLREQGQKKPVTSRGPTYVMEKSGAGQVVLIGPPNAGKSQLLKALTNAEPTIADYPFSTHTPAPAMMPYENIQIQLVDTPPITSDFIDVWHSELVKSADGVLIVLDLAAPDAPSGLLTVMAKLEEKRIEFVEEAAERPSARLIPWSRVLVVGNKADLDPSGDKFRSLREGLEGMCDVVPVSGLTGEGLEDFKVRIYRLLRILRVYSKIPGKRVDSEDPFIFKIGSTLMDMAQAVHKDFSQKLKFARIWGKDKYQGQKVTRDYILQDEDVIELHI